MYVYVPDGKYINEFNKMWNLAWINISSIYFVHTMLINTTWMFILQGSKFVNKCISNKIFNTTLIEN